MNFERHLRLEVAGLLIRDRIHLAPLHPPGSWLCGSYAAESTRNETRPLVLQDLHATSISVLFQLSRVISNSFNGDWFTCCDSWMTVPGRTQLTLTLRLMGTSMVLSTVMSLGAMYRCGTILVTT